MTHSLENFVVSAPQGILVAIRAYDTNKKAQLQRDYKHEEQEKPVFPLGYPATVILLCGRAGR